MRTISQSNNYSPRETNMEYQEWCEVCNEDEKKNNWNLLR